MKKNSTNLYSPYVNQLMDLLHDSSRQENPAYWLHLNKARTPLFMLEAITRVLYRATNDEFAKKWYKLFKKLEDTLGEIDYHDAFTRQFKTNRSIKKEQVKYLSKKLEKVVSKMNKRLKKEYFYLPALQEFIDTNPTNFNDKGLLISLHEEIKTEVLSAEEFFSTFHNGFTDFEEQVHALRRKLRWISIYGASLGGYITLKSSAKKFDWEKQFITKKETESKFNKLPVKKGLAYYIPLDKKAFYALSHVIDRLGEIKDKGLAIETLAKTIRKTAITERGTNYTEEATTMLKTKENESELLKSAYDLLYDFFVTYKIHVTLIS